MNEQQSQNLLLKVDPFSTIRNNKLTRKVRNSKQNISSLPSVKAAICKIFCFSYFGALRTQRKIFILFGSAR